MIAAFDGDAATVLDWLNVEGVREVRLLWSDVSGLPRGKALPPERFASILGGGFQYASAALAFDGTSVPAETASAGAALGHANVRAVPDLPTLRVSSHLDGVALCLLDTVDESGAPVPIAPRSFTKQVERDLSVRGSTLRVAPELEAYLLRADGERIEPGMPCYAFESTIAYAEALRAVVDAVSAFAPLEAWHHEHGPGQLEINVAPLPLLEAADALFLARSAGREAAAMHGFRLTWMAKPLNGLNGSACQVNMSLAGRDGSPSFHDGSSGDGLSSTARHFVGGLLEHLDAMSAVLLPNANSFRRVLPGHFAPVSKAWGFDNRTAALRVIADSPASTRVEVRVPGADIAAHLALPLLAAAGLDGVDRGRDPGPPAAGDLERQETARIIDDWRQALDAFDASDWAARVMGAELHALFLAVKRQEYERWRRHVSDFDRVEYGAVF